ncbi:unnamed protein product [Lactuca virosa]|uniref:AT-hook motif nuclear-localized protein n=1 Tax=Lactuca virosa TaxID=75947 RepID=A0AAU9PS82_9ASTR|nr:unnamed protein product [Lactuca virosa]
MASSKEIAEARDVPSLVGTALSMAVALKKDHEASLPGVGFMPHILDVKAGEGRFEILYLCGSFMVCESDGQRSRTGGLSVSLSGPDGRVLGGNVAGLLTAASPVQMIVGSIVPAS